MKQQRAPVFPRRRGNPKGNQTPGGFLCFFLGRARKKKQQRLWFCMELFTIKMMLHAYHLCVHPPALPIIV